MNENYPSPQQEEDLRIDQIDGEEMMHVSHSDTSNPSKDAADSQENPHLKRLDLTSENLDLLQHQYEHASSSVASPCRQVSTFAVPDTRVHEDSPVVNQKKNDEAVCTPRPSPPHEDSAARRSSKKNENRATPFSNFCRASSSDSVVTPPFLPSTRHHDFFLDGSESSYSEMLEVPPPSATLPPLPLPRSGTLSQAASPDVTTHPNEAGSSRARVKDNSRQVSFHFEVTEVQPDEQLQEEEGDDDEEGVRNNDEDVDGRHAISSGRETPKDSRETEKYRCVGVPPPFDAKREQQFNLLYFKRCPEFPLYPYREICHWQKYNPYIRTGYRAYYNTAMTLKSVLGWHNETLNIWSHFSGFFFFVAFSIAVFATLLTKTISSPNFSHVRFMYLVFCGGSILCMLNSSIYHLFTGHCRHKVVVAMGRLDFLGITALIVSSFLPPLYTMFSCLKVYRNVYIALILVLGFAGLVGPWTKVFHEHTLLRTGIYVGMVACGAAPSIHYMLFFPHTKYPMQVAYGIMLMIVLYAVGVVFYITRLPESRFPGHFDYFFSSHQLWHFFVLMAAIVHYFNCLGMYQAWLLSDGAC